MDPEGKRAMSGAMAKKTRTVSKVRRMISRVAPNPVEPAPLPPIPNLPPLSWSAYLNFVQAGLTLLAVGSLPDPVYRQVALALGEVASRANLALCGHAAACNPVLVQPLNPQTDRRRG